MSSRKKKRVQSKETESDDDSSLENLRNINREAYNNLVETRLEILKTEPNIIKILEQPLFKYDRANLLQLYEIYKITPNDSEEWLELRNKIIKLFDECKNNYSQYCMYTKEQHVEMKKQLLVLDNYNQNVDLQYKILQLQTSIQNKKTIYSRYKELKEMSSKDEEKGKLKNWLNWAISIPHDNIKTFPYSSKNQLTDFLLHISKTLDKD